MVDLNWPSPLDLVADEQIEIEDSLNCEVVSGRVVDIINGVISVSIDAWMTNVMTMDPKHSKWRRLKSKVTYGAQCADKFCPVGFYEHAEVVPGWKCRSCKNR